MERGRVRRLAGRHSRIITGGAVALPGSRVGRLWGPSPRVIVTVCNTCHVR